MSTFPIYLEMSGRRAVVIGAGSTAIQKMQALHDAGARVTVIAEHVPPSRMEAFGLSNVELVLSSYSKNYLVGATLVIAATGNPSLNRRIFQDCQELEILCSMMDFPEQCDFYTPATIKRGDLKIAVGTDGNCPAYMGHICRKLELQFTETHGRFVNLLEIMRKRVFNEIQDINQRKAILGHLASDQSFNIYNRQGEDDWIEYADARLANAATA